MGGNSGGPILIAESKVVIGMPSSYMKKPSDQPNNNNQDDLDCHKYFKDFGIEFPTITEEDVKNREQWNKLDRNSGDLSNFPTAIPMHLIVNSSAFLKQNPQYISKNADQSR